MAPRIRLKRGDLAALLAAELAEGEICFATDEKIVLVSDGVGKYHVSSPAFDIRENRPSPGLRGSIFVATDTKESWIDDGTLWQPIVEFGIASGSCCEGDDPRLSDSRTPTSHTHGGADITDLIDYISGLEFPYAPVDHDHNEDYSALGHTHDYAASSHSHGSGDITDATSTPTGAKIPISDAQGTLDSWVSLSTKADTDHNHDGDYSAADHDLTHLLEGSDEIDGDKIGIDFTPDNYTPATVENISDDLDHLSSHLKGIDAALAASSGITAGKSIALSIVFGG